MRQAAAGKIGKPFGVNRQMSRPVLLLLLLANVMHTREHRSVAASAKRNSLPGVQRKCTPRMTKDEAQDLLVKALQAERPHWVTLPGFGIDSTILPEAEEQGNFLFDLTWANPVGSVNLAHYGVHAVTGDIWEPLSCRPFKSRKIRALQRAFRKRTCLTESELKVASQRKWCWN
jgi:hypothetical protein